MTPREARATRDAWNFTYPVGHLVRVKLPGMAEGVITRTRSDALIVGGAPVVWVNGYPATVGLEHITPIVPKEEGTSEAAGE